jgi:hypothetical protein
MLKDEFLYYLENQSEFVKKYNGKVIVLKDKKVIGVYEKEDVALYETKKIHEIGTFLIQKCTEGNEAYTQTFHSRVAFA